MTVFVIPATGETVDPEEVMEFARGSLATFKAPKSVAVVEELPTTATGKIRKRQVTGEHGEYYDEDE